MNSTINKRSLLSNLAAENQVTTKNQATTKNQTTTESHLDIENLQGAAIFNAEQLRQQLKISVENNLSHLQTIKNLRIKNKELIDQHAQLSQDYSENQQKMILSVEKIELDYQQQLEELTQKFDDLSKAYTNDQNRLLCIAENIKNEYEQKTHELQKTINSMAISSHKEIHIRDEKILETIKSSTQQIFIRDSKMIELVKEMSELNIFKLNAMAKLGNIERKIEYHEKYVDILKEHHELNKIYYESYIQMMKSSLSWKITLPLRILKSLVQGKLFSTYIKVVTKKK